MTGESHVPLDFEEKAGFAFLLQATESVQTYARFALTPVGVGPPETNRAVVGARREATVVRRE
jgi:hypothetical protein